MGCIWPRLPLGRTGARRATEVGAANGHGSVYVGLAGATRRARVLAEAAAAFRALDDDISITGVNWSSVFLGSLLCLAVGRIASLHRRLSTSKHVVSEVKGGRVIRLCSEFRLGW